MKRTMIIIAVIIGAIAIGLIGFRIISKILQESSKPKTVVYSVGALTLKKENVELVYMYKGIAEGDPQVKVYSAVAGNFLQNAVREGANVYKDQDLVYIYRDVVGANFQPAPVRSPIAGVVKKLYFTDRGTAVMLDKPVAEIANNKNIKVVINIGEDELTKITAGMKANIYSVYNTNLMLSGSVYSITPFVDSDTLSGSIIVKALNTKEILKAGMSVDVDIIGGEIKAFMIPQSAVQMGLENAYVFINSNSNAIQVNVELGYSKEDLIEVKGDLKDGDQLITEGSFKLYNGAKIQILK